MFLVHHELGTYYKYKLSVSGFIVIEITSSYELCYTDHMTLHQQKQIEVINQIEVQIVQNTISFSTVSPVEDYDNDNRVCFTSVHIPHKQLLQNVQEQILEPLKKIEPSYYYYTDDDLHMTIKNIRKINNPPTFTDVDTQIAKEIFSNVIPKHKRFNVYFYRLLLFPHSLALIGTTDDELDNIYFDLDEQLTLEGLRSDLKYMNDKYFYSYMTLARFTHLTTAFKTKAEELSSKITLAPYTIDSVTLLTCNAVFKKRNLIGTWQLQSSKYL